MTDIFETGNFSGPQALWDRINQAMLDAGWTVRATPQAGVERVYYSDGEDGYADNYLKVAHKVVDDIRTSRGFTQWADDDGYTDYVNFLGYQWYPNGGGSEDGYGEIGLFGPRLYTQKGVGNFDIRWTNLITGQNGDERWTTMTNYTRDPDNVGGQSMAFDGHRFIYYSDDSDGRVSRYDISNGATSDVVLLPNRACNVTCTYVREIDRVVIFIGHENTSSGFRSYAIQADRDGNLSNGKYLADFNWRFQYGCSAAFGRYIYAWQGENTNVVQVYDYLTDTWQAVTNMPTTGWSQGCGAIIATKEQTGLSNHRIYTLRGQSQNDHYYMDLEDDGLPVGFPGFETWNALGVSGDAPFNTLDGIGYEWDGNDRIFYWPGTQGSSDRELYYYNISTNNWTLVGTNYMYTTGVTCASFVLHYSYQSRVRAFLGENQKYWIFANKNRVAVITKSEEGQYFYCYAGSIDSYFDDTIREPITSPVSSGSNVVLPMANTSNFAVGQKIQIFDSSGGIGITSIGLDKRTRRHIATEHATITSINPNVSITVNNLNNNYSSGSVVGFDLQNMIVTVEQTRYAQATNLPNTSNTEASGDSAEQVYVLEPGVEATISTKADLNARTQQFVVWPLICFTEGTSNRFSGREVRGQLYNTFMMGTGAGSSEDIVEINGQNYLIFDISGQRIEHLIAFGPVL